MESCWDSWVWQGLFPGINKEKFSIPCVSGTLVVSPGIFQVLHWRQVTVIFEVRYSFHWVYQELLDVGLIVQQTWMRSQRNQLTISLSYIVKDKECHSVKGHINILLTTMVMDSSVVLKSWFNVTAFINKTQVFIYDKSNFIKNPLSIYKYVHSRYVK